MARFGSHSGRWPTTRSPARGRTSTAASRAPRGIRPALLPGSGRRPCPVGLGAAQCRGLAGADRDLRRQRVRGADGRRRRAFGADLTGLRALEPVRTTSAAAGYYWTANTASTPSSAATTQPSSVRGERSRRSSWRCGMSVQPETAVRRFVRRSAPAGVERAFLDLAVRFGHPPAPARRSDRGDLTPVIDSVGAGRELLPVTPEQRARRQAVFFTPQIALRRAIGQGVHDRLEAAVFADGADRPGRRGRRGAALPVSREGHQRPASSVAAGDCWDLSVRGAEFGLDDFDDLLVLVNVGELVLEAGASVRDPGEPAGPRGATPGRATSVLERAPDGFHLGILPTPFSVDPRRDRVRAADGIPGRPGMPGAEGGWPGRPRPSSGRGCCSRRSRARRAAGPEPMARQAPTAGRARAAGRASSPTSIIADSCSPTRGSVVVRAGAGRGLAGGAGGDGGPVDGAVTGRRP